MIVRTSGRALGLSTAPTEHDKIHSPKHQRGADCHADRPNQRLCSGQWSITSRRFPRNFVLGALLSAAIFSTPVVPAARAESGPTARGLLVWQLINDARAAGRDPHFPPALAARQALVLLQEARRLDPDSSTVLRLLAEAADALKRPVPARGAWLALLRLEPHNTVAQVRYLDTLAAPYQSLAARQRVYRAALVNPHLEASVRSAAALRLGRLLEAQARVRRAGQAFLKAVRLDPANLAAWRRLSALLRRWHAPARQRLYCRMEQLHADPYQPWVLAAVARLLSSAGDYAQAAHWGSAALGQWQYLGAADPRWTEAIATWRAIAGPPAAPAAYLAPWLARPHPPTRLLMVALAAYRSDVPGSAGAQGTAEILSRLQRRLAAALRAKPNDSVARSDQLWLELAYATRWPAQITARVAALRSARHGERGVYLRLRGWQLLRQGRFRSAAIRFRAAGNDPYALLGLARIAIHQGRHAAAAAFLKKLWRLHPPAPAAVAAAALARRGKVALWDPGRAHALGALAAAYPNRFLEACKHPGRVVQVSIHWRRRFSSFGAPMAVDVHYVNATPWTLAVGPDTAVSTSVALAATLDTGRIMAWHGAAPRAASRPAPPRTGNLGAYAVDADARVLSLAPQGTLIVRYRVDQGRLARLLWRSGTMLLGGRLTVITNPLATAQRVFPGWGGQSIDAGYFQVRGLTTGDAEALAQLAQRLPRLRPGKQMLAAGVLLRAVSRSGPLYRRRMVARRRSAPPERLPLALGRRSAAGEGAARATWSAVRARVIASLYNLLEPPSAGAPGKAAAFANRGAVQAWLVRRAPVSPRAAIPPRLSGALAKLVASPDPLVRMMSYRRIFAMARRQGTGKALMAAARRLRFPARTDKDPLASRWAADLATAATDLAGTESDQAPRH